MSWQFWGQTVLQSSAYAQAYNARVVLKCNLCGKKAEFTRQVTRAHYLLVYDREYVNRWLSQFPPCSCEARHLRAARVRCILGAALQRRHGETFNHRKPNI